jgi:hypothetical protein
MKKVIGLLSGGLALVIVGCGGSVQSSPPKGPPTEPSTTPYSLLAPAPGSVIWERSGGIAGLCQELTLQADGSYVFGDSCRSAAPQSGQLPQDESDQLQAWLTAYQSFTWSTPNQPGSADMFSVTLRFQGTGSAPAPEAVQSMIVMTIGQWASNLTAPANAEPTPAGSQGIEGRATLGPACPVARAEDPCPDRPYQATVDVLDGQGGLVKEFQTAADGSFRISLPPGTYTLQGVSSGNLPLAPTQAITVQPGRFTQVTLSFDSGIR